MVVPCSSAVAKLVEGVLEEEFDFELEANLEFAAVAELADELVADVLAAVVRVAEPAELVAVLQVIAVAVTCA